MLATGANRAGARALALGRAIIVGGGRTMVPVQAMTRIQMHAHFRSSSTTTEAPKKTIDEVARAIDTTLTPEQRDHVEMLKRKIKGGPNSPRSLYRDVPRPDELTGVGNFLPKIADNAQELIDFALSHIPKRAGPRRSRYNQRLLLKNQAKQKQHAERKVQLAAAKLKKDAKLKRQRILIRQYKEEAAKLYRKTEPTVVLEKVAEKDGI